MSRNEKLIIGRAAAADFFAPLTAMPPVAHWPDRSQPFHPDRSELMRFIRETFGVDNRTADRIFGVARQLTIQAIVFDPATKRWSGNPAWTPSFAKIGTDENVLEPKFRRR